MKKGVTFMTVIAAVIIMIIFVSTVTISSISILNDSNKNKFATEIAFIQETVNNYYDKNNEYPILNSVIVDLQNVNENDIVQFEKEDKPENSNNSIVLYELDFSKLGTIDRIYGNSEEVQDIYAVSKTSGIVYYLKGVHVDDITYFTLTDELKNLIDYVDTNENTVTKDGILFEPSTLNWTANNISTRVLVPNKYSDVIVSVLYKNESESASKNIENYNRVNSFNEYIVSDVVGNYFINVTYKNNEVSMMQTYSITNFDNDAPTFEVSDRIDLVSRDNKSSYSYIEVKNVVDDLSGIKYIKYEKEKISDTNTQDNVDDIAIYFKSNGIELYDEMIEIDDNTNYITVYVEDNAGNYRSYLLNVQKEE